MHALYFPIVVYYALVSYFLLDYASASRKSPQSSRHYGSEITHASPTQRSAKEFVDSRLAQPIFELEHANNHAPQAIAPHLPASSENPGVSENLERPSRSTGRQQPSSTPGSQFSPDQLSQLRELIAETVGFQRSGPGEAPRLLAEVPLLSPASPLNIAATTATEQNLNGVNLPNVIQDGGLSLRQLVPSLSQASQGPAQQIVTNQAYENDLTLPLLPEKLRSKVFKHEYIEFKEFLSDNRYPYPSFASSQNNFTLTVDP